MGLQKQAKILTSSQQKAVIAFLSQKKTAKRDIVMFLLSCDAGLRSKEIATVDWKHLTDSEGNLTNEIRITNEATKGKSGGVVYLSNRLKDALASYAKELPQLKGTVVKSARGNQMTAQVVTNWFWCLYRELGFEGCSSHSGRRTAITRWGRNISQHGGSIKDVMMLARHSSLAMTSRYIEQNVDAMKSVVG